METRTKTQNTLDENIPKDVISTREQARRTLSYLESWYVIDRLNQVLGQGQWGYQIASLNKVFEGKIEQRSGEVFATSYTATVSLFATIDGKTVIFSEVGYGDGTDKSNPGKAHELGTKEAVSDGLKRAAKNLGRSMGLALYDKTQEYVDKSPTVVAQKSTGNTPVPAATGVRSVTEPVAKEDKTIAARVVAARNILEAQKKITRDAFKVKYQKNVAGSKLTTEQLSAILEQVKIDYPHLTV